MSEEDALIGEVVAGRYRVLEKMGEGGMGTVYLAEHITIEKKLALKVLLPEYARKADLKERFLREARAAAAIGHENIVDITDFGDTPDGSVFFAMEFLDGRDLAYHIKTDGAFHWTRAKPLLLQVCRALGAAHSKSIVHRDMKPENIFLIEREGRPDFVKVLDFGIAKVSGLTDGEQRLTRTGMIFGTPEYMSPEQAQGHSPDHRVDIYAVGVIMYELLTGQVPFRADTFMGILTKHIFEEPLHPSKVVPELEIPADVEAVVLKAMSKDREQRFQSMTEMAAAISQTTGRMTRPTGDALSVARVLTPAGGAVTPSRGTPVSTLTPAPAGSFHHPLPPAEEVKLPTSRWRLTAGIGIAAVAIVGIALALGLVSQHGDSQGQSTAMADAGPQPKMVTVHINTTPEGASVFKGTARLGETPLGVPLPRSDKSVMLSLRLEGYRQHSEPFVPDADGKSIRVVLERLQPVAAATPDAAAPIVHRAPVRTRRSRRSGRDRSRHRRVAPRTASNGKVDKSATQKKGEGPTRVEDLMNPFGD